MSGGVEEDEIGGVRSRVEMFERMATTPKKQAAASQAATILSPTGKVREAVHQLTSPAPRHGQPCENRDPQALVLSPGKVKHSVQLFQEQGEGSAPKRRRVEAAPASAATARSPTIEEIELRESLGIRPPVPQPVFEPQQAPVAACTAPEAAAPAAAAPAEAPSEAPEGLEQYSLGALWGAGAAASLGAAEQEEPLSGCGAPEQEEGASRGVEAAAPALEEAAPAAEEEAKEEDEAAEEEAALAPAGLESYALNMRWDDCPAEQRGEAAQEAAPEPTATSEAAEAPKKIQLGDLQDDGDDSFEIEGLVQEASDDMEAAACAAAAAPAEAVEAVEQREDAVVQETSDGAFLQEASDSAPAAAAEEASDSAPAAAAGESQVAPELMDDDAVAREFERQDRERALERDASDGFQDAIEAESGDEWQGEALRKGGIPHHVAHTPITRSLVPSTRSGKKRKMEDLQA